ncbi:MAG: outer membrane protein assembly factor BamA [Verrucomicrobia bacterium]|jgi:outer membrane protein insertion porin family|nr:outer membrane protein assembly factor BamA [Verrucomicrobiota bacterium]|tara:strand:+ start:10394 stop:12739 length:2346 start_codon:yes stop_codon:yes gene_type:complete
MTSSKFTLLGLGSLLGRISLIACLFITAFSGQIHAQDFEGKNISEVAVRYRGAETVDEARLRNLMSTKAGTKYRAERLDNDIKTLFESGLVDDVRFLAEPVGNGVRVIADVLTRDQFSGVGFVGNTIFSDQKLAKETKLKAGGTMSDATILEARRNLEKYYQGYGYPDVLISHRTQATGREGMSDLIFVIDEGAKNEVRKIRFEGNTVFTTPELKKEMKTKEKGWFSWLTKSGRFESGQLDEDLDAVLDYYRSKGYLRANSPGMRRDPVGDGRVDLVIPINEGEKYTVAGVSFGRMTVFKSEELYPSMTLNGGDAYSSKKMRDDIKMIRSFYGSRGYADATVNPDIKDAGPNRVTIKYQISEGSRYRVGKVNIQGNIKTKDKVIRREVPLNPGDWFNTVELETTKARLENLQYFGDVQASGTPGGGGYRDVDILVEERNTGSVGVGIGFSSIDNVVGFLTLEQSNFDIMNPWNFTGGGQRFAMSLRAGSERSEFSVSLTEPWFLDKQLALGGELFYRQSNYFSDVYEQTNAGGAIFIRKPINDRSSLKLEYRLEQIGIDVDAIGKVPASGFASEDGDFVRSAVTMNYLYDNRDSTITPRSGEKIDLALTLAGGIFGGDVDTITFSAQGSKYWNLKWDTILSVNGELAFVDAINGNVPVFDRLFLGGGRTLRGFEFRDIGGNRDTPTGEVLGGQSLAFLSTEYTVPIIETVRAAVFYDIGYVNTGSWDVSPDDVYSDIGVGVRIKLPISPVPLALDYAIPVSSPDNVADKGGQFNFYLNYEY